jgi:hypothetical protein
VVQRLTKTELLNYAHHQQTEPKLGDEHAISRESSGYVTKKAGWFRHWVWVFYTALFPAKVIASIGWSILLEWNTTVIPAPHKWFDSVLSLLAIVSLLLYTTGVWLKR